MKTLVTSFSGLSISTVHSRTMDEREGEREEKKHFSLTNDIFWGIMKGKSKNKITTKTFLSKMTFQFFEQPLLATAPINKMFHAFFAGECSQLFDAVSQIFDQT